MSRLVRAACWTLSGLTVAAERIPGVTYIEGTLLDVPSLLAELQGVDAVVVAVAPNRLAAMLSLGIQGLAVALLFLLLGAPDLSFTQFMVEILSVAILALVMTRLRLQPADRRPWREVAPELLLAALGGAGLALFLISVTQTTMDTTLSDFYTRYSYVIAHGRNIVNVILVDFRAVDTFGEIAVVLTTGAAILALVRGDVDGVTGFQPSGLISAIAAGAKAMKGASA